MNQTKGRGRFNREWFSEKGLDLAFSTVYYPENPDENLSAVSLYAGYAVYKVLENYLDDKLNLKWPNDVFYADRKLGGILTEKVSSGSKSVVIIGIGININSIVFSENINSKVSSLQKITGKYYCIDTILNEVLYKLKEYLNAYKFPLTDDFLNNWKNVSNSINKKIMFEKDAANQEGELKDINNDCSLEILDSSTKRIIKFFGEVVFKN